MSQKKITNLKDFAVLVSSGTMNRDQLAKYYGCSLRTIARYMIKLEIPANAIPPKQKKTKFADEVILKLYEKQKSISKVQKILKLTYPTVAKVLKKHKII